MSTQGSILVIEKLRKEFKRVKALATFISAAVLLVLAPMAVEAQQAGKVYRIGFLTQGSVQHLKPWLAAFRHGLRELGYVEGKNIVIEE